MWWGGVEWCLSTRANVCAYLFGYASSIPLMGKCSTNVCFLCLLGAEERMRTKKSGVASHSLCSEKKSHLIHYCLRRSHRTQPKTMFSYKFKRNALKRVMFCGLLLSSSFLTVTASFAPLPIVAEIQSANDELIVSGSSKVYDVRYYLYKDGRLEIEGAGGFNVYLGEVSGFIKEEYLDQAKSIIVKNVRWIKRSAFENCRNVSTVTFDPSGQLQVQSIGDYAFRGCSSLKTITIPTSVSEMGREVFYGCI